MERTHTVQGASATRRGCNQDTPGTESGQRNWPRHAANEDAKKMRGCFGEAHQNVGASYTPAKRLAASFDDCRLLMGDAINDLVREMR